MANLRHNAGETFFWRRASNKPGWTLFDRTNRPGDRTNVLALPRLHTLAFLPPIGRGIIIELSDDRGATGHEKKCGHDRQFQHSGITPVGGLGIGQGKLFVHNP